MGVDGKIFLRQAGKMTHRLHFRDFRQQRAAPAPELCRDAVDAGFLQGRLTRVGAL